VLLMRRLEAFSVVIQDPPYFICYLTPPLPGSELKLLGSPIPIPFSFFLHFPSYLTCPFACRVGSKTRGGIAQAGLGYRFPLYRQAPIVFGAKTC
jgi:hypothetical protein